MKTTPEITETLDRALSAISGMTCSGMRYVADLDKLAQLVGGIYEMAEDFLNYYGYEKRDECEEWRRDTDWDRDLTTLCPECKADRDEEV